MQRLTVAQEQLPCAVEGVLNRSFRSGVCMHTNSHTLFLISWLSFWAQPVKCDSRRRVCPLVLVEELPVMPVHSKPNPLMEVGYRVSISSTISVVSRFEASR